ncbi:MAG: hypothetical protein RL552_251 [Actinomycetota bacterium]
MQHVTIEPNGAGVVTGDLEQVLDQTAESRDVGDEQVEGGLTAFGELVASRHHHLDGSSQRHERRPQLVTHVAGEPRVALDAVLQPRHHVVERLGQCVEIGVVSRFEACVEASVGDGARGVGGAGERAHDALARHDAQHQPDEHGDDGGEN